MAKCQDCGFLAHWEQKRLEEVNAEVRETGKLPLERVGNMPMQVPIMGSRTPKPVCFMRAWPLEAEAKDGSPAEFLALLQKNRQCDSFTSWQQGFSPKDHREMLNAKMLMDWQERSRKEDHRFEQRLAIIAGIFTIVGTIIGTLIGVWLGRG